MRHLLIISVGPVQEFIASARRSRDLWFGSWLLSEMSKAAARAVAVSGKPSDLIFPSVTSLQVLSPGSSFGVANKIVAVVEGEPRDVAESCRSAVLTRLKEITQSAFDQVHLPFDHQKAWAQVEDLPEFFWASHPLGDYEVSAAEGYVTARAVAEAVLAARKSTRDFKQVTWGADAPKSSLDGQRESVIPERVYNDLDRERLRRFYGVREGERLCGVGLLKRHGSRGEGDSFPSTSHVAALPLLERLTGAQKPAVDEYVQKLIALSVPYSSLGRVPDAHAHPAFGKLDGHLLFTERLREYITDDEALGAARMALDDFLARAFGGQAPLPYYSLLLGDGDRMGGVIDNQTGVEDHRDLSRALANFATAAGLIVERHKGSLVYAGGDDVLAFLPLHTALGCARELADGFRTSLGAFMDRGGEPTTFSVGLAVLHHLDPLSDGVALVRAAEREAKRRPGKNALAVTVSKRSGVDRSVVGTWGHIGADADADALDHRLRKFIELHRRDAIPGGVAYELSDLSRRLAPEGGQPAVELDKVLRLEALRIFKRKRAEHGAKEVEQTVLTDMEKIIMSGSRTVAQLAHELVVAEVFARAMDLAGEHAGKGA